MASNSLQAVYFKNLYLSNVKCFKGEHEIDLSDGNGKPAMWTVILGNNNTGKTTLLRCLADLEPIERETKNKSLLEISATRFNYIQSRFFSRILNRIPLSDIIEHSFPGPIEQIGDHIAFLFDYGANLFLSTNTENESGFVVKDRTSLKKPKESNQNEYFLRRDITVFSPEEISILREFTIFGYSTNRKMSQASLSENDSSYSTQSLFDQDTELLNVEEWLLQVDYAAKNNNPLAQSRLKKIKSLLTSSIFPDIEDFRFTTTKNLKNFVEVLTPYGWVPIRELGYGYQASIAWLGDLARRMFERYPDSKHPFHEPAIVLVDEIDLHLHPEWQRKIVGFLSAQFPNVQFIVTAHSPMIVQSADEVNVVLLEKDEEGGVSIRQKDLRTFTGWTVEEILQELMGLGERTHSDAYLALMQQFEEGLDGDNYQKVHEAYEELEKILHPTSAQRKLLKLQMAPLIPG